MQIGLWSLGVRAQPYGMGVGDNRTAFYGLLKLENHVSFIPNRSLGLDVLNTARSNLKNHYTA